MMRTRVVALAAATATALSGCSMLSGDEGSDSTSASESPASSESGQGSAEGSGDATTKTALAAGVDPDNPPKAIAKGVFHPADSDTVEATTIELLKLQPKDNVMLAVFRVTGEGRGNEVASVYDLLGNRPFEPVFIDLENLEKYRVIEDLTLNEVYTEAPLGDPIYMFTAYPLPRDGVEKMDLRMAEQMGAIEGVPMPQ